MPPIDRGTTVEGVEVSRILRGDDKVQQSILEGRRLWVRLGELLTKLAHARYDPEPNRSAELAAVHELASVAENLRGVAGDLRLHTELSPDESPGEPTEE
jgi:hypothetical protein